MLELCPFCRADLYAHCALNHPTCRWLECKASEGGCGTVIDPAALRATRKGAPVAWPYSKPT